MTNAVVSRLGQIQGAGNADALFLKVWAGEVLATFARQNIMMDKHTVKSISYGFSAQFPISGTIAAAYHTPGVDILGTVVQHNERNIVIDDPLVASAFIARIDEAKNHYDTRSTYTNEMGVTLSNAMDANIMQVGLLASRAAANITGVTPAGRQLVNAAYASTASTLAAGITNAAQFLDENNIPNDRRYCALRPQQYWLLASMLNTGSVMYQEVGGAGSYAKGLVPEIGGIGIVKTNMLPNSNVTTGPTPYRGDFTNTRGLVWHPSSVGTVKLMDLAIESWYDVSRLGTLIVARYACGHGILRPESAIELRIA
jgi:hypothetical protein